MPNDGNTAGASHFASRASAPVAIAQNAAIPHVERFSVAKFMGEIMNPRTTRGKPPRIECLENADDGESTAISAALGAEIAVAFGPPETTPVSLRARQDESLTGGLNGFIHWRGLYIRHVWIAPDWRGRGMGRALLERADIEARARGCVGIYLDTFDPGAARFYERCGFARCGEIANFPPGHSRVFLMKALA